MSTHIHESEDGVQFRVSYDLTGNELKFQGIRLLGADYQPVGPDLCDFLHRLVVLHGDPTDDVYPEGERYLSLIVREILEESSRPAGA